MEGAEHVMVMESHLPEAKVVQSWKAVIIRATNQMYREQFILKYTNQTTLHNK